MKLELDVPESVLKLIRAANVLLEGESTISDEISLILESGLKQKLHSLIGPSDVIVQMDTPLFKFKTEEKKMAETFFNKPNNTKFNDPSGIGVGLGDEDESEEKVEYVPPTTIADQEREEEQEAPETFSAMVQSGITDQDIEDDMSVVDPNLEAKSDSSAMPLDNQDSDSLFSQIAGLPRPNAYSEDVRVAKTKARFAANDKSRRGKVTAAESFDEGAR